MIRARESRPRGTWAALFLVVAGSAGAQERPALVLQITVDQLRGDSLQRFGHMMSSGGFQLLLDDGLWYADAHHRHANTETIVGHTTLATGTDPAVHGMIGNVWFDRDSNRQVYNVEDAQYPLVGAAGVDADTEIDPTQRVATSQGRSPRAIVTTTISDEIAIFYGPEAKVFGVSVKDRGAISMAGHAGTAYWFSKSDSRMVTSTYYLDAYPEWVDDWNDKGLIGSYADSSWSLERPRRSYLFGDDDDQPWETSFGSFGQTFPHPYGPADGRLYSTLLTLSPAGDEIVADFAKTLIDAEALGRDETPDYLAISFSSTDYVGHLFGPSSLEAEDNFARLDATLADLFEFIDSRIGLERTLIVLSSDHGAADHPDYLAQMRIGGGLVDLDGLDREPAIQRLKAEFGIGGELVTQYSPPYVYLNAALIEEAGLDQAEIERVLAQEIVKLPGISDAISSIALTEQPLATSPVRNAVLANFSPSRSGDIYVVFEPQWFVADFDGLEVAAHHGSPWAYDTHVPVLIRGPGVPQGRIARRVETVDVAPTIAAYLGTKYPSGTRGVPLSEVVSSARAE